MEFFQKEKLTRLEEERQRRRQQRAEEAVRRLDEVGKQTLQVLRDGNEARPKPAGGPEDAAADASGRRPGALSRVLLEAAAQRDDNDPRRAARRGKRTPDPIPLRAESQSMLRGLDQAMRTIQGAVTDTASAGLKGGLESAARQVSDVVARVSQLAQGSNSMQASPMPAAHANPLADLMAQEQEEELQARSEPSPASLEHAPVPGGGNDIVQRGALGERGFEMTLEVGDASAGPHAVQPLLDNGAAMRDQAERPVPHAGGHRHHHLGIGGTPPIMLGRDAHPAAELGSADPERTAEPAGGASGQRTASPDARPPTAGGGPTGAEAKYQVASGASATATATAQLDPGNIVASATGQLNGLAAQFDPRTFAAGATGGMAALAAQLDPRNAVSQFTARLESHHLLSPAATSGQVSEGTAGRVQADASLGRDGAPGADATVRRHPGAIIARDPAAGAAKDPSARAGATTAPASASAMPATAPGGVTPATAASATAPGGTTAASATAAGGATAASATAPGGATAASATAPGGATAAGATPSTATAGQAAPGGQHAPAKDHRDPSAGGAHDAGHPASASAAGAAHAQPAHGPTPGSHGGAVGPQAHAPTARTAGPAGAPHSAPHSATPPAARHAAVQPATTPKGSNKAPVSVAPGGAMTVQLQKVAAPPETEIPSTAKQVVQPSFNISAKAQSADIPAMPADLASQAPPKSQTSAPPAASPAPAPATTAAAPRAAAAQPLPAAGTTATKATNPAMATGRAAASAVKLPSIAATPAAAGGPAGTTATPGAGPPGHPGASAVKTAAPTPKAPPATPVPKTPMTPAAAAPQTPAPVTPPPQIAAISSPGGDSPPNPGSLVQPTVSLSGDRSAAQQSLQAEAHTETRVGPEAAAQRASQIAPLGPEMQQTEKSSAAPKAAAISSATTQGTAAATQGRAQETQAAAGGKQQIAGQMQGAQAERARAAAQPPPAIVAQTSPAAMQGATSAVGAAVASAAHAVAAQPAQLHPATAERAAHAMATPSTLPGFDGGRFAAIDQHPALPQVQTAAFDGAQQASAGTYQQSNQQISQLSNIPAPVVNLPAGDTSGRTKGGQPTREAAIARIEAEVGQHANAAAPAQMRAAAAPRQQQMTSQLATTQASAQSSAAAQMAQHQSRAQELQQGQPPITGAQAAAQAQPAYQSHQAEATQASQQMAGTITTAQGTATTQAQVARGQRDQQITSAQQGYQQTVQGQLMPQYAQQQTQANTQFHAQDQSSQQAMATDQQQAQAAAQQQTDAAKGKADAETQAHQAQLAAQQSAASASHDQQVTAANAQHDAQMQAAQQQSDQQVQQHQSDMQGQVQQHQAQGQAEVNQHLSEGEQGYQQQISQGQQQADAEKAKAEQEAAAKKQQAESEKSKHSGGLFGSIVGWVKDRVNDLIDAAKAVLEAAKNLIVSIMEKARQAAMAVLEKARQLALAALAKVKSAIQGIISACAAAIRAVISACAALVRGLIQTLANALKSLVQALTTLLTTLVQAFQAAVNAVLDGLIAAVSLVNKDLGDKLRNATQKYRDAFNNAMNKLQSNIQAAGAALQAGIQHVADQAIAQVDAAEKMLDDAVSVVENTLNAAVEAAYQVGAAAINKAFDAAEAVVNKAFDVAEAAVKAYFDAQIGALGLVQKAVDAVADFVVEVANKALEAVDKLAQAIVAAIPDSWTKALVDFWNGPWRTAIIIGLATIAAVAITAASFGTLGPVAMVLMAGVIGGTIAGTAYFGGEMLAREGEVKLSSEGDGMYVPGIGKVQIGPDGKPIPPKNMTPEQKQDFDKQAQWALSNFNLQRNEQGEVTGYDRKSGSEIANYAVVEGVKGFGEGFISSALAVAGGGVGGALTRSIGNQFIKTALESTISNAITGPVQSALTSGWDAGFTALSEGKSPMDALKAAGGSALQQIKDPGQWASALVMSGIAPAKLKLVTPRLNGALEGVENKALKTVVTKGTDVVVDTMGQTVGTASGNFIGGYYDAITNGKSPSEALEAGRKRADEAFKPEAILQTTFINTAGAMAPHGGEHGATHEDGASEPHPTSEPSPTGEPHPTSETHPANENHPSGDTTQPAHTGDTTQPAHTGDTTQPVHTDAASKPRPIEPSTEPHPSNEPHPSIDPNPATAPHPRNEAQPAHDQVPEVEPTRTDRSVQEQIDRVTGIDKGPEHEQAMADLRDQYTQQNIEGQETIQVAGTRQEGPYSWQFGHDATEFSNGTTHVEYRVYLDGTTHNITPEQMAQLRENIVAGVDEHYNYQHDITNSNGDPSRLHMEVVFVTDPAQAHTSVEVQPGDGPANLGTWYVDGSPTTHAHEIGHGAFGFLDEYHDPRAPDRATPTSPGVSNDGSLMGDYWVQAPDGSMVPADGTSLQQRHLDEISDLHSDTGVTGALGAPPPAPEHVGPGHEPNAPTPDLEQQLAQIDRNEIGTSASVEAVRNARAEIATMEAMRDSIASGSGQWEHATPEQREQQTKLLDDRIHATAQAAVEQHATSQPETDSAALRAIQDRTPEQARHRADEVAAARAETARRDQSLVDHVHHNTVTDEHGQNHVEQVFDHITVGNGFAGVANEMSRPSRGGDDIVIGGANPWDGAKSKFGQPAGDSELPNHIPGHGMTETSSDPAAAFMIASEHADNVALNRNDAGITAYDGRAGSIEPGPQGDWPQFAKDGGATSRTLVVGPDGEPRYFYTKQADVAAGPGPNRRLAGDVMDEATFQRMQADNAIAFGDQAFHEDSVRPGEIASYGPGASGAWVGEAAGGKRNADGTRANDVEWIANHPELARQITDEQRQQLTALDDKLAAAKASGDPDQIHAAQVELTNWTFESAARNGNLPRNQGEGGAFHPDMQAENGGPISRRVTEGIDKVTYEPQVEGGPDRVKITLKDLGPDGQPVVLWKDSLVLSIGQDARGPGGPVELVRNYKGELVPIYGPEEPGGFRPVVGVQSPDGSVRVLGAAATVPDISHMLDQDVMTGDQHQQNLQDQAARLDPNSKNVVQGFVLAENHIEAANNAELARILEETPAEQRADITGHTDEPPPGPPRPDMLPPGPPRPDMLPPGPPRPGERDTASSADRTAGQEAEGATPARAPVTTPLSNHDAMIEQLAHGMVDKDLTAEDLSFLRANGYKAEPIVRGEREFVMRTFLPTEEGKPPIVAFRGTVPTKLQTVVADLDPQGIGMYQVTPNRELIDHEVQLAAQHGPIVFSGHSLGGALAQTVAARYPGQAEHIVTFQAPGVSRETAKSIEDYNAAHPDHPIESSHHRVAGDLVPFGGEALTPGVIHNHEMVGGNPLGRNPLSKHVSLPLAQEELAAGHDVPVHGKKQVVPAGEVTTEHDNAHKTQSIEHVRAGVGRVLYGAGGAVSSIDRLFSPRRGPGDSIAPRGGGELPPAPSTLPHHSGAIVVPHDDVVGATPHDDVGAVKGAEVYPQNTREKDGATIPVNLNDEKIKKALKPVASQLGDVKITKQVVSGGGATFTLTVPHAHGTAEVHVELTTKPAGELAPSTAHGDDAGPARLALDHDAASNKWTLRVEIDRTVRPEDVHFVIGHELNEAAELIRRNPGGKPAGGFGDDMTDGVMKAGATTHEPTAHDVAAAREVVELDKELTRVRKDKPAAVKDRQDLLDRAIKAQGLDDPSQIHAKLALLRDAGASPELISRVQMVEVKRVLDAHEAAIGGKSTLEPALVQHLLFAGDAGGFKSDGLKGGHLASELKRFVEDSGKYALLEVKTRAAGGTTLRQFEQYRWDGSGARPAPGSDQAPGGSAFDPSKWTKSTKPKTTFDDASAFLAESEAAWKAWLASGAAPSTRDRSLTMISPSGIQLSAFAKDLTAPYQLATIFIEASWM